ncbi:MAG: hypothetical protein TREMPRED_002014 [Tremellales sp. Tagirdzhanova-0007]|nr:MAG: hypothetical protein TREMPRED_002014 [Tremellales sp. Tagirdzhanova-0007]
MTVPISPQAPESSRSVVRSVYAVETKEGVGATVRRSIGSPALKNLTPFLMYASNFTLTLSLLTEALERGDVQWMTAGRGIMHSEVPLFDPDPAKVEDSEGLQLWVDLPMAQKFIEPSYQERKAVDIATVKPSEGVEISVISGESHGVSGFVRPVGGCWYLDFKLRHAGASVFQSLPAGWTAFVYIISGHLEIGDVEVTHNRYHTLVLSCLPGELGVRLTRPRNSEGEDTRFVLIAGEPLDQPVVQYGPFVVTSEEQVREAIMDYRGGKNGFEKAKGWRSEIGKAFRA